MKHPIRNQSNPLRLLLYLEWILLGMSVLTAIIHDPHHPAPQSPILTILDITGFGLIGLRLPTGRTISKVAYTGLEFGLVLLPTLLDSRAGIRFFPLLCLVVVIRSCLVFKPQGRLMVAGLAFMSFLVALFLRAESPDSARPIVQEQLSFTFLLLKLNFALFFGLILIFVLLLINALLAERQSREKLTLANEQLRQYAMRLKDQVTLQERNRIARDIHDSLGHSLTALNIQLEGALKLWQSNPQKAQTFLAEAKRLGSTALQEVRQSVSTLRSDPLQGRTLEEAIAALVKDTYSATGILPDYSITLWCPLSIETSTAVYRIVQEGLTNICRHAAATKIQIYLSATATDLSLVIEDNGKGFRLDQNTTGFGLQGMRERAVVLGGKFDIESEPGAGCRITAHFPLMRLP
ncbi:MAG: sensor histidine kinase, partial [Chroococcidiopsidaceae cyanobacterium CP_BM_RX_35]|nr:sensor histidine kinase [Chroococcidiopsidaceae cyanobacterium CP_BM_RX_35]